MLLRPVVGVGFSKLKVAAGRTGRRGDYAQDFNVFRLVKRFSDDSRIVLKRAEKEDGGHVNVDFNRMQPFGGRF